MKKLLLSLALLSAAIAGYGQGQIIFQNNGATAITNTQDNLRAPGPATRVALYVNANTGATEGDSGWVRIYTTNVNTATPGQFFGGTRTLTNDTGTASFPGGTAVRVQVRAWLAAGSFASYEEALAGDPSGYFGTSVLMTITPAVIGNPAPNLVNNGFQSIFLVPNIPEPSSIALGILGLGAIALFRRRK